LEFAQIATVTIACFRKLLACIGVSNEHESRRGGNRPVYEFPRVTCSRGASPEICYDCAMTWVGTGCSIDFPSKTISDLLGNGECVRSSRSAFANLSMIWPAASRPCILGFSLFRVCALPMIRACISMIGTDLTVNALRVSLHLPVDRALSPMLASPVIMVGAHCATTAT